MKKLTLAFSLVFASVVAQASTVSSSFINSLSNTEIDQSGSLSLFNSNLGALTGIALSIDGTKSGTVTLSLGNATAASRVNGTATSEFFFTSTMPELDALLSGKTMTLTAKTGFQLLSTNSSQDFGPLTFTSQMTLNPAFAGFSQAGGGIFDIGCTSVSDLGISGGGGFAGGSETRQASCGASIVYTYTDAPATPVDEPASLALVGLALAAAGVARRRKA